MFCLCLSSCKNCDSSPSKYEPVLLMACNNNNDTTYTLYNAFLTIQISLWSISKSKEYVNNEHVSVVCEKQICQSSGLSLNFTECSQALKKLVNSEQEELPNSYLFSEKFRSGHSKELSEYGDSYEEKKRDCLLLSGELFSFHHSQM